MEDDTFTKIIAEVRKEDQKKYCKCISKSRKLKFENYKMKNGRVKRMDKFAYYFENLSEGCKDLYNNMSNAQKTKIINLYEMSLLLPYNFYITSNDIRNDYWKDEEIKDKHRIIKLLNDFNIITITENFDPKDSIHFKKYCRSVDDGFVLHTIIVNYTPEKKKTRFQKALETVTERGMEKGDFFDLLRDKYNKLKELYPLITEEEFLSIENSYNIEEYKN